jgi:hypothetical protein
MSNSVDALDRIYTTFKMDLIEILYILKNLVNPV